MALRLWRYGPTLLLSFSIFFPFSPLPSSLSFFPFLPLVLLLSSRLAEKGVGKSDKGSLILTTMMLAAGYEDQCFAFFLSSIVARLIERVPSSAPFRSRPTHHRPPLLNFY